MLDSLNLGLNWRFFSCMALKLGGWHCKTVRHLFFTASSFLHHFKFIREIRLELQSGNAQLRLKSPVTLKFDGWSRKTIGHLFYTKLCFVHHFKTMGEFKLESQSRNAQFGSKAAFFLSPVTLKFDGWPWKTIGQLFYMTLSVVHHFKAISEFKLVSPETLNSGQNWRFLSHVTFRFDGWTWKTRASLLCCFKLCASFHSHHWIQT